MQPATCRRRCRSRKRSSEVAMSGMMQGMFTGPDHVEDSVQSTKPRVGRADLGCGEAAAAVDCCRGMLRATKCRPPEGADRKKLVFANWPGFASCARHGSYGLHSAEPTDTLEPRNPSRGCRLAQKKRSGQRPPRSDLGDASEAWGPRQPQHWASLSVPHIHLSYISCPFTSPDHPPVVKTRALEL
jgi:hypothetical protein